MQKAKRRIVAVALAFALVLMQFAAVPSSVFAYEHDGNYTWVGEMEEGVEVLNPQQEEIWCTLEGMETECVCAPMPLFGGVAFASPAALALSAPVADVWVTTSVEFNNAIANAPTNGDPFVIGITDGFTLGLSGLTNIPLGANIILVGGGVLTRQASTFRVQGTLTMHDIIINSLGATGQPLVDVITGGEFIMHSGTIRGARNNISFGGAVGVNGGTFTMYGGSIIDNIVSNANGGGVHVRNSGVFNMHGGTIAHNTSGAYGGGVYVADDSTFEMTGGVIYSNTASNVTVAGASPNINITGGAIGSVQVTDFDALVAAIALVPENGFAVIEIVGTIDQPAVLFIPVNREITFVGDGTLRRVAGGAEGIGIVVTHNATLTLDGITITAEAGSGSLGGITVSADGTLIMRSGAITGNTALHGGAVSSFYRGTFRMYGGVIENNTAQHSGGGVYFSDYSTFILRNGTIRNNTVHNAGGGGVTVSRSATMTMHAGIIENNVVNGNSSTLAGGGGGVHVNGSSFTMHNGQIRNNTAFAGGGVTIVSSNFTMEGGVIRGNTTFPIPADDSIFALNGGGGVSVLASTFIMNGGAIELNESIIPLGETGASLSGGGVALAASGRLEMNGGRITNNITSCDGGGVHLERANSVFILNGGTVENNTADNLGNNVYNSIGDFDFNSGYVGRPAPRTDVVFYMQDYLSNATGGAFANTANLSATGTTNATIGFNASGTDIQRFIAFPDVVADTSLAINLNGLGVSAGDYITITGRTHEFVTGSGVALHGMDARLNLDRSDYPTDTFSLTHQILQADIDAGGFYVTVVTIESSVALNNATLYIDDIIITHAAPYLTLSPTEVTITTRGVSGQVMVELGGNVIGETTFTRGNLPAWVLIGETLPANASQFPVSALIAETPTTATTGNWTVQVHRGGETANLIINVDLPEAPENGYDCEDCNDTGCEECTPENGYNCDYCNDAGCEECTPENGYNCEYCNDAGCEECENLPAFVPVTSITNVNTTSLTAGQTRALSGTVAPANATNQSITWSVASAGTTGATISGSTLTVPSAGTVTITATITNGLTASTNFTQNFTITVNPTGSNGGGGNWQGGGGSGGGNGGGQQGGGGQQTPPPTQQQPPTQNNQQEDTPDNQQPAPVAPTLPPVPAPNSPTTTTNITGGGTVTVNPEDRIVTINIEDRDDNVNTVLLPGDSLGDFADADYTIVIALPDGFIVLVNPEAGADFAQQADGGEIAVSVKEVPHNLPADNIMLEVAITINGQLVTEIIGIVAVTFVTPDMQDAGVWSVNAAGQQTLLPIDTFSFTNATQTIIFFVSHSGTFVVAPLLTVPMPTMQVPTTMHLSIGNTIVTVGNTSVLADYAPFISPAGRTMVPLRLIVETMDGEIDWDGDTQTIGITSAQGQRIPNLVIGQPLHDTTGAYMGTPEIRNSRTFVPLRFVAESLGAEVDWDGATQSIYVTFTR